MIPHLLALRWQGGQSLLMVGTADCKTDIAIQRPGGSMKLQARYCG
jgi:hypothetical protein